MNVGENVERKLVASPDVTKTGTLFVVFKYDVASPCVLNTT